MKNKLSIILSTTMLLAFGSQAMARPAKMTIGQCKDAAAKLFERSRLIGYAQGQSSMALFDIGTYTSLAKERKIYLSQLLNSFESERGVDLSDLKWIVETYIQTPEDIAGARRSLEQSNEKNNGSLVNALQSAGDLIEECIN